MSSNSPPSRPSHPPALADEETELSSAAKDLVSSARRHFEMQADGRLKMALLGRVLAEGDESSSTNSLSDSGAHRSAKAGGSE